MQCFQSFPCFQSALRTPSEPKAECFQSASHTPSQAKADFGAHEIKLIEDTWAAVKTLPAEVVGGLLFKHIFEQADVSSLFSFGREPGFDPTPSAVELNPDVRRHGVKVVHMVSAAVGLLRNISKLAPVLKDLGAKHAKYGVVEAHYPVVGSAFLDTLRDGLKQEFTPEVEAAYTAMWGIVQTTMLAGVKEADSALKAADAAGK